MSAAGLHFVGAIGTVTGSKTIVRSGEGLGVVDYGLYQGLKKTRLLNRQPFFVPASEIGGVAITHAHIDHSGLLPRLAADGYAGPVVTTRATAELLGVLLPDSAHLQEEEAEYANREGYSKHAPALPLYTTADAANVLKLLRPVERGTPVTVAPGIEATFRQAGHILGSSWISLAVATGGGRATVVFSGDLGRRGSLIMPPPDPPAEADVVVIESTYGDRLHPPEHPKEMLRNVLREAIAHRSVVVVPAFAVGRTEDVLYLIASLERDGEIPAIPVWVDSPLASAAFRLYEAHRDDLLPALREGADPFRPAHLSFSSTPDESKRLNGLAGPAVIVSASGMATGGRVLHHLKRRLPDRSTIVLLCGYQAQGSRGRALADGAKEVKIHGGMVPVRAQIRSIDALSSHGDRDDLLAWLGGLPAPPKVVLPVHGEDSSRDGLADAIRSKLGWQVTIPTPEMELPFDSLGLR